MICMAGLQVFIVRFFFQGARKGKDPSESRYNLGLILDYRLCIAESTPGQAQFFTSSIAEAPPFQSLAPASAFYLIVNHALAPSLRFQDLMSILHIRKRYFLSRRTLTAAGAGTA